MSRPFRHICPQTWFCSQYQWILEFIICYLFFPIFFRVFSILLLSLSPSLVLCALLSTCLFRIFLPFFFCFFTIFHTFHANSFFHFPNTFYANFRASMTRGNPLFRPFCAFKPSKSGRHIPRMCNVSPAPVPICHHFVELNSAVTCQRSGTCVGHAMAKCISLELQTTVDRGEIG